MISDAVRFRYEGNRNAERRCVPVKVERKWNAFGTQMERKWNANGTHLRTRFGRVPNAFSVRLFLSSTVLQDSWSISLRAGFMKIKTAGQRMELELPRIIYILLFFVVIFLFLYITFIY